MQGRKERKSVSNAAVLMRTRLVVIRRIQPVRHRPGHGQGMHARRPLCLERLRAFTQRRAGGEDVDERSL